MPKFILKNRSELNSWRDTSLVLLVLVYSGNQALGRIFFIDPQLVALALFFGFLLIRGIRRPFSSHFVVIAGIFAIILLAQCINFSFYPFVTMAGFFVRLFIGYALIRLVDNFPRVFVRAMVGLALLSFAFYIPYLLLSAAGINVDGTITRLAELLGTASVTRRPLFMHTFMGDFSPRNAGMFWEPTAFAGYLILALAFLAIIKKEIAKQDYKRYLIILSITLFTTLSSTGYIIYPFVLILHYEWGAGFMTMKRKIGRGLLGIFIILPLIMIVSIYSYHKFDFLKEKIDQQLQAVEFRQSGWNLTRFGSLVFDWEYIKRRPLTGWGLHENTRYALHPLLKGRSIGMGNGFSDFTAKFGIFGMLVFLIALYRGMMYCTRRNRTKSLHILLIVMLVLQSEAFLGYPLFLGLMFLNGALKQKRKVPLNPLRIHPVRDMHIRRGFEF